MVQSRQVLHIPGFVQDEKAEEDEALAPAPLCWRQPGQVQLSPHPQTDGNDGAVAIAPAEAYIGIGDTAAASNARSCSRNVCSSAGNGGGVMDTLLIAMSGADLLRN